jgi:flavorubredoxin
MNTPLYENIDWVGCVDWTVRDFHGYDTQHGSTYNAYLVRDEKTALVDTVKAPFAEQLLANLASLTDPARVDFVVCNHAEPDHAGALPQVLARMPQATLVCDKKCAATLAAYVDVSSWKIRLVATGDRISLGRRSLQFVETPMLHWPESMFTYVPEEKLLFSMDAFGQHYASTERFDDETDFATLMDEAKTYYANIIMPYGKAVLAALQKVGELPVHMIATSHGIVWRTHIAKIIEAYRAWAAHRCQPKVLVIYDSMWGSTATMAEAILAGATRPGVTASLISIRQSNLTRIAAETLDAAAVAFGSSTLNRTMMPMAAAALNYLQGLRPLNRVGAAFGSYGWGRGGPEAIDEALREMDWEILREPIRAHYRPTAADLDECRQLGQLLAERALVMAGTSEE